MKLSAHLGYIFCNTLSNKFTTYNKCCSHLRIGLEGGYVNKIDVCEEDCFLLSRRPEMKASFEC